VNWSAINDRNAIERARISVSYVEPLTAKITETIKSRIQNLDGTGLSQFTESEGKNFEFRSDGTHNSGSFPVWYGSSVNSNGAIVETFTVQQKSISFETVFYNRWKTFSEKALYTLEPSVDISSQVSDIAMISLEYWDRFIFDDHPSLSDAEIILSGDALKSLPAGALGEGKNWHISRGWTQELESCLSTIRQLIQTQDSIPSPQSDLKRSISIYTRTDYHACDVTDFRAVLDELHSVSKSIFKDCLSDEGWNLIVNKN